MILLPSPPTHGVEPSHGYRLNSRALLASIVEFCKPASIHASTREWPKRSIGPRKATAWLDSAPSEQWKSNCPLLLRKKLWTKFKKSTFFLNYTIQGKEETEQIRSRGNTLWWCHNFRCYTHYSGSEDFLCIGPLSIDLRQRRDEKPFVMLLLTSWLQVLFQSASQASLCSSLAQRFGVPLSPLIASGRRALKFRSQLFKVRSEL